MRHLLTYLSLALALTACAAPRGTHEHFGKPKYRIHQQAKDGRPNVSQRWWSTWWFWQSPGRERHDPSRPKYQPSR